jgi:hypothetical protein
LRNKLLDIYLNVKEDELVQDIDTQLKISLRDAVNNHVIPQVKFLSHEMTNIVRGSLERRNLLSSFPSFWMPDFSDRSQDGKVAHIIVNRCGMGNVCPEEKARFWVRVRDKVKPIINNYRSNTANALKKNVLQGSFYYVIYILVKSHAMLTSDIFCVQKTIPGLRLMRESGCDDDDTYEEPMADYPPISGGQAEIDAFYFKKHAPALSRVLSFIEEDDVKGLFLDEATFASFVYNCLSTTIKKGTWRLGRNKKLVSELFTPCDEALALLILENNANGIRDLIANGRPDNKKKIKTKYTCRK